MEEPPVRVNLVVTIYLAGLTPLVILLIMQALSLRRAQHEHFLARSLAVPASSGCDNHSGAPHSGCSRTQGEQA